jgi:pimeloyl-ACP methyl ester carboxylesterase
VPAAGAPLFQAAVANLSLFGGETPVSTDNPDRGPVLVIAGGADNTVPAAITHATQRILARHSSTVTELVDVPGRGHSLTIDHGWREVADLALAFVRRFH